MVYGTSIKLPGEFFDSPTINMDPQNFVAKLQQHMAELKPLKSPSNRKQSSFAHKDLKSCSHVFIRIERVKKALEPPYEGPYTVQKNDFLENIDHNLAYYEIPAQLACAYLKGHLKGRALDWFEVLGYRVIEDKATDYAHLKQALSEQFPLVRNRTPQILDYVEVRHPQNTANLLQIVDKYEERFMHRQIRGSSAGFRSSNPNVNNRFNTRHRQENWRENGNNARYANNSRPQREFNRFENHGFANNRRFEGRRQGGQSDQRFHNQGDRQSGSRNSSFRGQHERSRHLNF
ncbi:uncharacterized protein TNCV_131431 [Trichonephila clavipes]|nr:uncharacterized protein TNCV_131431 [Trichonephila clavipes]